MVQTEILDFLQQGAFYRKPEGNFVIFKGEGGSELSYQDFFSSSLQEFTAKRQSQELSEADFRHLLLSFVAGHQPQLTRADFKNPWRQGFDRSFAQILNKIHGGEIDKALPIVSSRCAQVPRASERAFWILNLMSQPSRLHLYGLWNSEFGVLGASPEILFHIKSGVLKTMAVAGTLPKSQLQDRLPLLEDSKEIAEHQWVIADLKTQLATLGSVQVGKTESVELPHLFHLMTDLKVQLNSQGSWTAVQLCRLLHPTPALGVSPRSRGFQWLKDLPDQSDRGLFGAPVVFRLSVDEMIAIVAIRNIQWFSSSQRQETLVSSGCGLVKDSDLEREWQELMAKQNSTFQTLGIL